MKAKRIFKFGGLGLSIILSFSLLATFPAYAANAQNPIIWADVPDPDVIRVGNNYYMTSTTMHMNPGVPIMKSTDLVNWEIVNYVYDTLENGDKQNLNNGQNEYGQGSWASSLRYRNGRYYVVFVSNASGRTYIYQTTNIETGPWTRYTLNSLYHDPSLLFDDDGRVYLIYGGGDIRIIELNAEATAIRAGGLNQVIIPNAGSIAGSGGLAAEGAHAYKINGRYYVFLISWPSGGMRTELVYRASSITGAYEGQIALRNSGIAQGGVVDTPDGRWYAMLFQDKASVGRIPYLIPMTWSNGWPVLGNPFDTGINVDMASRFVASDEFNSGTKPGLMWQWNHNPDNNYWSLTARPGFFRLTNGSVRSSILNARNTLTQRTFGPDSSAIVAIETGNMRDGDYAGLAAFQFYYGFVGVRMTGTTKSIVMVRGSTNNPSQASNPVEVASVPLNQNRVYLKVYTDFRNQTDKAYFYYSLDGAQWTALGSNLQMAYTLPHFMGYRFGLFNYGTRSTGGYVDFDFFRIQQGNSNPPISTPTPTATQSPSQTDPIVWYRFDETGGTTAADASGNGRNATLVNGPTWVGGRLANAVDINGGSQHVSLPGGIVSGLNDFSIATWVKLDSNGNWRRLFDFGSGTTSNMFLVPQSGSGAVRFAITTNGAGGEQQINGTSALSTNTWHHVTVTKSGSTGRLYVDGVQVGQNTGLSFSPASLGSTANNWIGRSQYSGDAYLDGQVDDFRIYNRALSASEIQSLFNIGGGTPTPTPTSPPTQTPPPSGELLTNGNIESGTTSWSVFGSGTLSAITSVVHGGAQSLLITGRTASWNGISQNVTSKLTNGRSYTTNVWVRSQSGTPSAKVTLAITANGSTSYITLAQTTTVNSSGWTLLSGTANVSWSGTLSSATFYVETTAGTDSFYIDDASFR